MIPLSRSWLHDARLLPGEDRDGYNLCATSSEAFTLIRLSNSSESNPSSTQLLILTHSFQALSFIIFKKRKWVIFAADSAFLKIFKGKCDSLVQTGRFKKE